MIHAPKELLAGGGFSNPQWSTPVFDDFWINDELLNDVSRLKKEAVDALRRWDAWQKPAVNRVANSVPKQLQRKACDLIWVAYASGVQAWVSKLLAIKCVIRTRGELATWCRLQFAVLDRYASAFQPAGDLWPTIPIKGGELASKDVTDAAIELVTATFDATPTKRVEAIAKLGAMPNLRSGSIRRVKGNIPSQPRCEELVSTAWKYMRALGDSWPVEPAEVADGNAARRCLDQVFNWCNDDKSEGLKQSVQNQKAFSSADLRRALDVCPETLNSYAKAAEVPTPGRGKREHRYSVQNAIAICNYVIGCERLAQRSVENARTFLGTLNRAK